MLVLFFKILFGLTNLFSVLNGNERQRDEQERMSEGSKASPFKYDCRICSSLPSSTFFKGIEVDVDVDVEGDVLSRVEGAVEEREEEEEEEEEEKEEKEVIEGLAGDEIIVKFIFFATSFAVTATHTDCKIIINIILNN